MENVNIRINALAAQLQALQEIPRTFAFNVRKALAPALANPSAVLKVAEHRLKNTHTDFNAERKPTSINLDHDEIERLEKISEATTMSRDGMIRLMLDYYLNYTRKGEDPAQIYHST